MNTNPIVKELHQGTRHLAWATLLRGIFAVAFGVIAIANTRLAAGAFVVVFAVYAFIDAGISFTASMSLGRAGERWGWFAFEGLIALAAGILALVLPSVTLLALVLVVAVRAIMLGMVELVGAFSWAAIENRWLLGLTGALSLVLGVLLLASPTTGAVSLIWTIGLYAIVFGIALISIGLRLVSLEHQARPPASTAAAA
jgi:uncharacterized membrane protein HdeD (DUF308 family)